MPYLVTCPNCGSKLKSANPVPAGKSVACPQCKTTFKLSEPAPEIDAPAPAPARPAPTPAPAPRTARSERPAPSRRDDDEDRPRRRRDDDEEDERPRSRRRPADDEEEDRPRSRRRRDEDDDEDERPRSRRRPVDDEEDERPRGRRSRDDEDEERPRSRKARAAADDDDEEDDDRPRRRGRGKNKSKKGLVLLLGALAALFLLFVGGAAFMYFVDPFNLFGGGASSDMLAWMPSDTQQIEGLDVDSVSKNSKALAAVRNDLKDLEAIGIKAEDMSSVMQGKKGGKGATAEVTVAKLKSSADKDKISKAAGGTEATASGKKYYKTKNGGGLFFPSDKIVVLTRSENTLTGLLQKEDGKVVINDELKSTVKRADGDMWMAATSSAANMFGDAGGGGAKGGMPGFGTPPAPKNSLATAKMSGDDVNMKMELTFADADTAKKAADQIDSMFKMMKGMVEGMDKMFGKMGGAGGNPAAAKMQGAKKMFDTMKVTTSGSVVTITMTAPIDSMEGFGKGGFGM